MKTYHKIINRAVDPLMVFENLREGSNRFLLESADIVKKFGEKTILCTEPSLKITIKDSNFEITALDGAGAYFISSLKEDFKFAKDVTISHDKITGFVEKQDSIADEESRLKEKSVFDVLRQVAFKYKPSLDFGIPSMGLFGIISYDAIDYFETLPKNLPASLPDFIFYYALNLLVIDHISDKSYIFCSDISGREYYSCMERIKKYEKAALCPVAFDKGKAGIKAKVAPSVEDRAFSEQVKGIKEHINCGDIFQCVLSRSFSVETSISPLSAYASLKSVNPGPYMFYFEDEDFCLLGSSPETCLKVTGKGQKTVEINPIAGTLPRGKAKSGSIDPELDGRLELDLLLDEKELAEHCMLLDLARNDIAKVSQPGSRAASQILKVHKYSHVQHLVSCVTGTLQLGLDALHAYAATMNMGTLTGAPKIKAMELLRLYEKGSRGFYGGSVGYLTPDGEFDSCIIIRSILFQGNIAQVRSGAGIVYDSDPDKETMETSRKAAACLKALGVDV